MVFILMLWIKDWLDTRLLIHFPHVIKNSLSGLELGKFPKSPDVEIFPQGLKAASTSIKY